MKRIQFLAVVFAILLMPGLASAGLTFVSGGTNRVDSGHAASVLSLTNNTVVVWVLPTSFVNNMAIFSAGDQGLGTIRTASFRLTGTTGNVTSQTAQTTTQTGFITSDTPLLLNQWGFLALTYDQSASPRSHIYHGAPNATVVESTYSSANDGAGTRTTDGAGNVTWGNEYTGSTFARSFPGTITRVQYYNRTLSLGELRILQFSSGKVLDGLVDYHELGYNGVNPQPDWSGKNNTGTVFGPSQSAHTPINTRFRR